MYLKDHCDTALWKSREFIFLSSWFRAETDGLIALMLLSDHCSIKLLEKIISPHSFYHHFNFFFHLGRFQPQHRPLIHTHWSLSSSTFSSPRTTSIVLQPPAFSKIPRTPISWVQISHTYHNIPLSHLFGQLLQLQLFHNRNETLAHLVLNSAFHP